MTARIIPDDLLKLELVRVINKAEENERKRKREFDILKQDMMDKIYQLNKMLEGNE